VANHPNGEIHQIRDLAGKLKKLGEEHFRKRFPHPFLVAISRPPEDREWMDPRTAESKLSDISDIEMRSQSGEAVAVAKSNRNAFKKVITVGRARNNDIVLRAPKISKLHAQFVPEKDGCDLMDMGSANGTTVNGVQLNKDQSVRLNSGDEVAFWRYTFEYHDPDSFIEHLRKQP
jgi:pSer/pThr/pTyr-binding forkhead associated (FHA) protein